MRGLEQFSRDMGSRPTGYTVDRIDNASGYAPSSCRWATYSAQARNTRRNVTMTLNGRTMTVIEWAEELGVSQWLLRSRLKLGWSDERALTAPRR